MTRLLALITLTFLFQLPVMAESTTSTNTVITDSGTNTENNELGIDDEITVLTGLKNKCADLVWCNSKFDISFNHLKCSFTARQCELKYEVILKENALDAEINNSRIPFKCTSTDLYSKEDLTKDGSVTERYMKNVGKCIESVQQVLDF